MIEIIFRPLILTSLILLKQQFRDRFRNPALLFLFEYWRLPMSRLLLALSSLAVVPALPCGSCDALQDWAKARHFFIFFQSK